LASENDGREERGQRPPDFTQTDESLSRLEEHCGGNHLDPVEAPRIVLTSKGHRVARGHRLVMQIRVLAFADF
jgi:hypothetical protein